MSDNYEKMKVAELKQLLQQRGLPLSGTKPVLISRLRGEEPPKVEKRKLTPIKKKKKGESDEDDEGSDYEDHKEKEHEEEEDLSEGETEETDKEDEKEEKEEEGLPTDISKMKVVELKEALRKRNLSVSGVKQVLVDRLQASVSGEAPPPEKPASKPVKRKASDVQEGNVKKKKKESEDSATPADVNFSVPPLQSNEWRIVSWNVTSFNTICAKGFGTYLTNEDPHIICLNETKVKEIPPNKFPGYVPYLNPAQTNTGYSGVAILTKIKPLSITAGIGSPEHDKEGRVLTAEFPDFYLVASYVPNSGAKGDGGLPKDLDYRMKWDAAFFPYLQKLDQMKPVILCGDLNVAHKEIDLANPKTNTKTAGFTQKERDSFDRLLGMGFFDVHRHFFPGKTGDYSFWSRRSPTTKKNNVGWRLDYFIASERLRPAFTQSFIRREVDGSDHCPIGIHVSVKTK
eukprot:TRINITY_DN204_c0_g1_i1.p1 TRINITY_DN204_c0_g1~~TRINITY_DN204_c0_g1_i1.p1  ORF type:complete len:457 (-),score=117.25 TRINITY_DN204_c0_g1_i1:19-1389(-)